MERGDHGRRVPQGLSQAIGTAYVDLHDLRPRAEYLFGVRPIARQHTDREPLVEQPRDHPPAEQPAATGHDDHGGSPLTCARTASSTEMPSSSTGSR